MQNRWAAVAVQHRWIIRRDLRFKVFCLVFLQLAFDFIAAFVYLKTVGQSLDERDEIATSELTQPLLLICLLSFLATLCLLVVLRLCVFDKYPKNYAVLLAVTLNSAVFWSTSHILVGQLAASVLFVLLLTIALCLCAFRSLDMWQARSSGDDDPADGFFSAVMGSWLIAIITDYILVTSTDFFGRREVFWVICTGFITIFTLLGFLLDAGHVVVEGKTDKFMKATSAMTMDLLLALCVVLIVFVICAGGDGGDGGGGGPEGADGASGDGAPDSAGDAAPAPAEMPAPVAPGTDTTGAAGLGGALGSTTV